MRNAVRIAISLTMVALIVSAVVVVQYDSANAVPAFARKYSMSCTTCHAPIPRLKAYGEEFAGNGFVLEDQDAPRYYQKTGDDQLDLIRDFPIAIRMEGFVQHQTVSNRDVDLSSPYNIKLMSGGALTKDVAYYVNFYLSEQGEVVGIEDAIFMFNNLFGSELDLLLGQFLVSDPLFKDELRLTFDRYHIYATRVGRSGIDLKYGRGVMATYGLESGTDLFAMVVNGNGIEHADEYKVYDNDKYKNFVGRISQDVGEYLRVGGFGLYGKERGLGPTDLPAINEVTMLAGDLTAGTDKFEFNGQYMLRNDDNPNFLQTMPTNKVETHSFMGEAIFMPDGDMSRWYAVGLYNKVDSDLNADDLEIISGHIGYVLRTNIRLILEETYDIEAEENRITAGFIAAF